ncbi:MAG TPA: magnesium and cobalt transport protein CorA [Micromonosporaceae bacterium]|nr:magnesium and cobalt transport protein CorA [Micromonosporaceae bacterium]
MPEQRQRERSAMPASMATGLLTTAWRRLLDTVIPQAEPVPAEILRHDAVVDCAVYVNGQRQAGQVHHTDAFARARGRRHAFVWLGLHQPDAALMASVARTFSLHELTVEQTLSDGHRPAVEKHGDVTLLVLRTARYVEHPELTASSEVVDTGDVMVLVGRDFVITVRHGPAGALGAVRADLEQRRSVLAQGPWAVAHAVCARMVGLYHDVAGHVEKDLEKLEETAFARDGGTDVQQVYQLKRELVEFKRAVFPLQAPLQALLAQHRGDLPTGLHRYFADASGQLARAVDRVAALDDLLNSILQARLAQVTVEQNNDMRKIASWAAIAAAQTAIAGIYGMNFDAMPELHWTYGYPYALGLMGLAFLTLYRLFRRSGWL